MLAAVLAGCGGTTAKQSTAVKLVAADGYGFRAPVDWQVKRTLSSVEARKGAALVSVTVFRLAKPFRLALWNKAVLELDRVAQVWAVRAKGKVVKSSTQTIAGRQARVYDISRSGKDERIAFVLNARREYQLYCRGAGGACDTLLKTFMLSA